MIALKIALTVILLLVEMLYFSPVVMPRGLINLFLVNYCCIMLVLWLIICQLVIKLFVKRACILKCTLCYLNIGDN